MVQKFNRLEVGGKVGFDKTQYDDTELNSGVKMRARTWTPPSGIMVRRSFSARTG